MADIVDVDGRRNEQRPVLSAYDFAEISDCTPRDVIAASIDWFGRRRATREVADLFDPIPLPPASPEEIQALASSLGVVLPTEYRFFLETTRSLTVHDGARLFGVRGAGSTADEPWVSDGHLEAHRFLVVGDYWGFADGDQLLFDVGARTESVFLYLHDPPFDRAGPRRRPCIEAYAPSFSLALHRLCADVAAWDGEAHEQ